jgi:type IV secretory pathway VirB10-like protein
MNDPIQDKAPKPAGLLPKHVQSWLILGLAVVMVLIMWLTGGTRSPASSKSHPTFGANPAPVEVNEAKIAELQSRIQQLQREQSVAQSALAQQSRYLASTPAASPSNGPSNASAPSGERADDVIQAERKKRDYLSLFASNVAVTYRKNPVGPGFGSAEPTPAAAESRVPVAASPWDNPQLAELFKQPQPSLSPPAPQASPVPSVPRSAPSSPADAGHETNEVTHPAAGPAANPAAGKSYVLSEGTILESVLVNRLDGSMSGPVECLLTNDVYSHDRQRVLIPAGSKVLGETRRVEAFGQARLAVAFHRLLMPDGYSVSLDQFKGLNQTGDAGLRDQVNNHYARIFGASLALGIIGAAAEAGTGGVLTESGTDRLRQGFGQSLAQSSEHALDRFLNLLPTITIREGHRVKVYLSGDLTLPDYLSHNLPSDL